MERSKNRVRVHVCVCVCVRLIWVHFSSLILACVVRPDSVPASAPRAAASRVRAVLSLK